ncbi:MAG TPA: biotin/lipoyl-binding protein [Vicinamibacterales bacterium]|nr:biotin/lipoyl-binding protein [Vicinamibacterales bacterium]
MRKVLFSLSVVGVLAGVAVAYLAGVAEPSLPPAFTPATNPYKNGIYATGIIESDQTSGENINLYPEVAGTVKAIPVAEGQRVRRGDVLLVIDDTIQRATAEQLAAQADAANALLDELRAQPRKETLDVAEAQLVAARAALKTTQDAFDKQGAAHAVNPKAVSLDALDAAANALASAKAGVDVATRQRDLIKAGAWVYDVRNQERQARAASQAAASAKALVSKYTLHAPADGVVMAIHPAVGSFISAQGSYDTYTQGMTPVIVVGTSSGYLNVRCYVDEILVPRLPGPDAIKAQMSVRGSPVKLPLHYVRTQPLVTPKIELSDQRQERVDVRVLPVIFRFDPPEDLRLYPGQLVDVYIGQ